MKIGTIYDITFSTNRADTWALANADSTPVVRITENGVLLAYVPTVATLGTGIYIVTIDASEANGFEIWKRYTVYTTAIVNSIAGALGIDSFNIETQSIDDVLATADYTAPDNAGIAAIPTIPDIVDGVWNEPLTWATHNVPTSAGRRLRQLGQIVVWDGIARGSGIWDNQIQLDILAADYDGAFDPSEIAIVAGTGIGQSRLILQYEWTTRMATVDRNWKIKPDTTSEFIIYVNSGREHVNEWLAQGGTMNTIILNTNASPYDNSYVWQNVFLRSWTWEDQVATISEYNGNTKVATISTARADKTWAVAPDTTTGYVILPYHSSAYAGWWEPAGGVGFYMSGWGGVDTKWIEKKFTEIMTEIKKEPEKYTKALETTKKAIVDTVKKMPTPLVNVTAPDVKIEVPPDFLQEIKTIVQNFNEWAEGKIKATDDAYTVIMKRFRENIAEELQTYKNGDKASFDLIIETAILRATSQFTQALSNITITEQEW